MNAEKEEYFFQTSQTLTIVATSVCALFLPFYLYGWAQFYKHRDSIIISKRFPALCVITSIVAYVSGFAMMVRFWIRIITRSYDLPVAPALGLAFVLVNMVTLRLVLVYLRYKQTRQALLDLEANDLPPTSSTLYPAFAPSTSNTLTTRTPSEPASPSASSAFVFNGNSTSNSLQKQRRNLYFAPACIAMYLFSFISFIWLSFCLQFPSMSVYIIATILLWTIQSVVMFVVVAIVLCNKVNDGIGFLKETMLVLCMTVLMILVETASGRISLFVNFVSYVTMPLIQGIVPLYGGLYFVRKFEKAEQMQAIIAMKVANTSASVLDSAYLPMHILLRQYENYKLFREYLSHCWAVENLLFLQNVAILTQLMVRYQEAETTTEEQETNRDPEIREDMEVNDEDGDSDDEAVWMQCGFSYLGNEFKKYNSNLSKIGIVSTAHRTCNFEDVKHELFALYCAIYDEFIKSGALHEVNISYGHRSKLAFLFEAECKSERFQTWDDFVHVFDDAMLEVYSLVMSMYNFDFREYIKNDK